MKCISKLLLPFERGLFERDNTAPRGVVQGDRANHFDAGGSACLLV